MRTCYLQYLWGTCLLCVMDYWYYFSGPLSTPMDLIQTGDTCQGALHRHAGLYKLGYLGVCRRYLNDYWSVACLLVINFLIVVPVTWHN